MAHARSARRSVRLRSGGESMADLFSDLPEELLHHVMSFLPAGESMATCLLARRWRHLWKSVPALTITHACDNPASFITFVNNVLVFGRDADMSLDSFQIDLHVHDEGDGDLHVPAFLPDNEELVNVWFRHAVVLGAQVLALRATRGIYRDKEEAEPMELLPGETLISRHLARLDLKLVHLSGTILDFSACPTLVDLRMDECHIAGDIFSPSLKHLSIIFCFFLTAPVRARIRVPSLVSLELIDIGCRAPLLERMPLLVSATVRPSQLITDSCPMNDCGDCGVPDCYGCYHSASGADDRRGESLLLNGLSEAAVLELSVDSQVFVINRDLKLCPTFSKLKTLLLTEWCPNIACDLNVLGCFLQRSPILEKVTLQISKVPKVPLQTQTKYTLSEQSSERIQLKIVEIECDKTNGRVSKIVEFLGTCGIPPEKLRIQPTKTTSGC